MPLTLMCKALCLTTQWYKMNVMLHGMKAWPWWQFEGCEGAFRMRATRHLLPECSVHRLMKGCFDHAPIIPKCLRCELLRGIRDCLLSKPGQAIVRYLLLSRDAVL